MALQFKGGKAEDVENTSYKRELILFQSATREYQRQLFKMHNLAKKPGSSGIPMAPASLVSAIEKADNAVEALAMMMAR